MTNIVTVLKTEIARVARKEVRAQVQALKKVSAAYRRDIAALKRRVQTLERQIKSQRKGFSSSRPEMSKEQTITQLRFSASRLAVKRKKLGLSAAKFAALIGVSPLSVYKWESGQSRPRRAQLEAIAAVRNLGKRAVLAKLDELQQG